MLYDIIWYESIEYVKGRSIAAELFPIEFNWHAGIGFARPLFYRKCRSKLVERGGGWGSGEMGKNWLASLPPNESETWL